MRIPAQKSRGKLGAQFLVAAAVTMLAQRTAHAKNCGGVDPPCGPGAVVCACGDTVTSSYVLSSTLDCRGSGAQYGLQIASGQTLSLGVAGVQIIGGNQPGTYGVLFEGTSGATLTGRYDQVAHRTDYLRITGWEQGVALRGGSTNNIIQYIEAVANGDGDGTGDYGIDLRLGGTAGNTIQGVSVHDNFDEGVHFGGGSLNNTLKNSAIFSNAHVQVYQTDTSGTKVLANYIAGPGVGGIRLKNTIGSIVEGNIVSLADILLDGGASYNQLFTNYITGSGRLQFKDAVHHNVVNGLFVESIDNHCVEFSSALTLPSSNRLTNSNLHCTGTAREIISGNSGTAGAQNLVCNTTCFNAGSSRRCVDNGSSSDDVRDDGNIIKLQNAACP